MAINPRTGLREGFDEFFKVPLVYQRGPGQVKFGGQPTAVHTVPYRPGVTLDFYSRLGRSDELFVSFHGANMKGKNRYPMFARVASLRGKTAAMMSFADPTLLADPTREMLLSWYLGGPGWDPLHPIIAIVRNAMRKSGSRHVAFLGGSGGGFAALRASAMVPGSMALVHDPQTGLAPYIPHVVDTFVAAVWPGWDKSQLLGAFPERFDMVRHYLSAVPENFVYYTQNSADPPHVQDHLTPFQRVVGIATPGQSAELPRRVFRLYDGELPGHGKITPGEFDRFFADAVEKWRDYRATVLL